MNVLEHRFFSEFGGLFPEADWGPAERTNLLSSIQYRMLDSGTVLMRDGDRCSAVPFVISGSIRVFRTADTGREITLYRIQQGQSCIFSSGCVGEVTHFPATAVVESETAAAFLPATVVRRLFDRSAPFRTFVLGQFARRLADIMELVEEVAFRHVDQRLKEWLVEHCPAAGDGDPGGKPLKVTHQELADHIGTSREVISRILKDWEDRGSVALARGTIRLLPGFRELQVSPALTRRR
jgi:CRP/FNR family transcriptional regulator